MSAIKDGGPAFPIDIDQFGPHRDDVVVGHHGMSLRDYFAGQALAGVLANHHLLVRVDSESPTATTREAAAAYAYAVADSLLDVRAKSEDK
jgi:hypothetical protein